MEDTISRKKTIEAMEDVDWYHINKDGQLTHGANSKEDEPLCKAEDVYKVLNDMPSAQPEIVRCKDCRHRDLFSCPLADNDFQKDEDFCSWGERREE